MKIEMPIRAYKIGLEKAIADKKSTFYKQFQIQSNFMN